MKVSMEHRHYRHGVFSDRRRLKIGILGGSFNPAHEGHAHIADLAMRHLRFDAIWWLVAPQNPLKPKSDMASFDERFKSALEVASKCRFASRMHVSSLERQLGFHHTALTLSAICKRAPLMRFAWLMGADNLAGFHQWHAPERIAKHMAIVVVNRPNQRAAALGSPGAKIAGTRITPQALAKTLAPKHWCFIQGPLNYLSASSIRAKK